MGGTLGNFKVTYDRVVDGVADVGFILTSLAGGKFKKLDVAELPSNHLPTNLLCASI
jgi:hypothetical protein